MPRDLKVEVIPSEHRTLDTRFERLPFKERLFKPPFRIGIIGKSGGGKSSIMWSIANKFYKNYFDEVVIWNGAKDAQEAWNNLAQRLVVVESKFDEQDLIDYMKDVDELQTKLRKEEKPLKRILLVFDDMIMNDITKKNSPTELEKRMFDMRHNNVSVMIASQVFNKISLSVRKNLTGIVLSKATNTDIEELAKEYAFGLKPEELAHIFSIIKSHSKYNCMVIDTEADVGKQIRENFDGKYFIVKNNNR